jgi:hypothetical protein
VSRSPRSKLVFAALVIGGVAASSPTTVQAQRGKAITAYEETKSGLRIAYEDGKVIEIPRERGHVKNGNAALEQAAFEDVRISSDRTRIGWMASYKICAQSYPCPIEIAVFDVVHHTRYIINNDHGIF